MLLSSHCHKHCVFEEILKIIVWYEAIYDVTVVHIRKFAWNNNVAAMQFTWNFVWNRIARLDQRVVCHLNFIEARHQAAHGGNRLRPGRSAKHVSDREYRNSCNRAEHAHSFQGTNEIQRIWGYETSLSLTRFVTLHHPLRIAPRVLEDSCVLSWKFTANSFPMSCDQQTITSFFCS